MLAERADKIAIKYFRNKSLEIITKDDDSPVTMADTEIEKLIRKHITEVYPDHSIVGEEMDERIGNSEYKWFIDPIDGTSSFISGKPLFTTLIALTRDKKTVISVISQPCLNEKFYSDGYKSYLNEKVIQTSNVTELDKAMLSTTSPVFFSKDELVKFTKVTKQTKYQKHGGYFTGGDAYQYAMLACGHIDIVIEAGLKPHDFLSLVPIIKNAGGVITDWNGNQVTTESDGRIIACANGELHQQVLTLLG